MAPTVDDFAAEAKAFLDANAEPLRTDDLGWGEGSDQIYPYAAKTVEEEGASVRAAQAWRRTKYDAGFGWISGPVDYGGRGLGAEHEKAYAELEARYAVPSQTMFGSSMGVVAPTILGHGPEWMKQEYLARLARGDLLACQLLSEPGAGSDLASLSTRAESDGDEWLINGQKVWSSRAHFSDLGLLLARSDPTRPKREGITVFLLPLDTPGVDVRPLKQMTGGSDFNETFLTDVRLDDKYRIGDVNDGWRVFRTTLANERASIGRGGAGYGGAGLVGLADPERVIQLARHLGVADDPTVRQDLARLHSGYWISQWNARRDPALPEAMGKLHLAGHMNWAASFIARLLGPRICADTGEWGTFAWKQLLLGVPAMRIGGGTDEVMKNGIGERALGLPREPAPTS